MQVQSVNSQSFQGLQCHPNYNQVEYVLATKLGWKGFNKADKCLEKLSKNRNSKRELRYFYNEKFIITVVICQKFLMLFSRR